MPDRAAGGFIGVSSSEALVTVPSNHFCSPVSMLTSARPFAASECSGRLQPDTVESVIDAGSLIRHKTRPALNQRFGADVCHERPRMVTTPCA